MGIQKGKKGEQLVEKTKATKKHKKGKHMENKRKNNVKTLETQPLYELFKFYCIWSL
jgi:hypothetical protein